HGRSCLRHVRRSGRSANLPHRRTPQQHHRPPFRPPRRHRRHGTPPSRLHGSRHPERVESRSRTHHRCQATPTNRVHRARSRHRRTRHRPGKRLGSVQHLGRLAHRKVRQPRRHLHRVHLHRQAVPVGEGASGHCVSRRHGSVPRPPRPRGPQGKQTSEHVPVQRPQVQRIRRTNPRVHQAPRHGHGSHVVVGAQHAKLPPRTCRHSRLHGR